MIRLAFGAKWSDWSAPLGFGEGFSAASAPKRSRRRRVPSAMAPRPVVLRARKARRGRVFSSSGWRFMESFRDRLVQTEQNVCHGGHRREFDLVNRFGQL